MGSREQQRRQEDTVGLQGDRQGHRQRAEDEGYLAEIKPASFLSASA